MSFPVGELVVCVGCDGTPKPDGFWEAWQRGWGIALPKRGTIYTVRQTRVGKTGVRFIRVDEIRNPIIEFVDAPPQEPWFPVRAFRPVGDIQKRVVRSLLTPAPEVEFTVKAEALLQRFDLDASRSHPLPSRAGRPA